MEDNNDLKSYKQSDKNKTTSDFLSTGQYRQQLHKEVDAIGRLMDQGGDVSKILTNSNITPDLMKATKGGNVNLPQGVLSHEEVNSNIKVFQKLKNEAASAEDKAAYIKK